MPPPIFRYRLYGLAIDSCFPLPGAPTAQHAEKNNDLTITWSPHAAVLDGPMNIKLSSRHPGAPTISVTDDGTHVLFWKDEIALLVSPDVRSLQVVCREEKLPFAPALIVGMALGFVLHLHDVLCLHGTVLGRSGHTIVVMGDSGSGKSSLAAAMVRAGATFYSDDVAAINHTRGKYTVLHGCMGLRLCSDSALALLNEKPSLETVPYLNKLLWDLSTQMLPQEPPKLDALYWLAPSESARKVEASPPLPSGKALQQLIGAWYPPYCSRLLNSRRLAQMAQLVEAIPVRIIRYKKRWDNLPHLLELLA